MDSARPLSIHVALHGHLLGFEVMENVNGGIRSAIVRAVFPDGSTEIMPTAVAVHRAKAIGLDLVVIAPTAVPPVAKAIDYMHWLRDNEKKGRGDT